MGSNTNSMVIAKLLGNHIESSNDKEEAVI